MADTKYEEYVKATNEYYKQVFIKDELPNKDELQRWKYIEEELKLAAYELNRPLSIIDMGCGNGWLCNKLSAYGEVTGIDLAKDVIEFAQKRYSHIRFLNLDANKRIEEELQTFDIVISSEVIEHVLDQENYFKNLVTVLKQDGVLILTTPNGKWKKDYFRYERAGKGQPYEFWLTREELKVLAIKYFDRINFKTFDSHWLVRIYNARFILNLVGNIFLYKFLKITGLLERYYLFLDKRGFGIYQIMVCKDKLFNASEHL